MSYIAQGKQSKRGHLSRQHVILLSCSGGLRIVDLAVDLGPRWPLSAQLGPLAGSRCSSHGSCTGAPSSAASMITSSPPARLSPERTTWLCSRPAPWRSRCPGSFCDVMRAQLRKRRSIESPRARALAKTFVAPLGLGGSADTAKEQATSAHFVRFATARFRPDAALHSPARSRGEPICAISASVGLLSAKVGQNPADWVGWFRRRARTSVCVSQRVFNNLEISQKTGFWGRRRIRSKVGKD